MNWQQTYRGSNLCIGWMRGTLVHDISLFFNAKPTRKRAIRFLLQIGCPMQITLGQIKEQNFITSSFILLATNRKRNHACCYSGNLCSK